MSLSPNLSSHKFFSFLMQKLYFGKNINITGNTVSDLHAIITQSFFYRSESDIIDLVLSLNYHSIVFVITLKAILSLRSESDIYYRSENFEKILILSIVNSSYHIREKLKLTFFRIVVHHSTCQ